MQINFNNHTNPPTFKAQFSKDAETKEILKQYAKEHPMLAYTTMELVNNSATSDIIKLKRTDDSDLNFDIVYKSKGKNKTINTNFWNFPYHIREVALSNGKKIMDYLPRLLSKGAQVEYEKGMLNEDIILSELDTNYKRAAGIEVYNDRINEIDRCIDMFQKEKHNIYKTIEKTEDDFMERYIETM